MKQPHSPLVEPLGFCSETEYLHVSGLRLKLEDLAVGGLYVLYTLLDNEDSQRAAAKDIVRIVRDPIKRHGRAIISLDVLDDDLYNKGSIEAKFRKGFWVNANVRERKGTPVKDGFLRPYVDEMQLRLNSLIDEEIFIADSLKRLPDFDQPLE